MGGSGLTFFMGGWELADILFTWVGVGGDGHSF